VSRDIEVLAVERALKIESRRARLIVDATHQAGMQAGGRVTISAVLILIGEEEAGIVKLAVMALFLMPGSPIYGRFVPHHVVCDAVLGPAEPSKDSVWRKLENDGYSRSCRYCGGHVEERHDIVIRVQFWLSGVQR